MNNENIGTVVLGFGPQPIDWLSKTCKVCGNDAVMDPDVARMAGANLAAGSPKALAILRKQLEAGAIASAMTDNPGLSLAAVKWLASGERGISSNTIFTYLTGIDATEDWERGHPYDVSDFRRCQLLLEALPELVPLFPKMADVSDEWSALVCVWSDIVKAMDEESPNWREGFNVYPNRAYTLIKRAIGR